MAEAAVEEVVRKKEGMGGNRSCLLASGLSFVAAGFLVLRGYDLGSTRFR